MKHVRIAEHGNADVLEVAETDAPRAGPGQVVVAVAAAGVNFIDTYHRSGLYSVTLPMTLGVEGAGRVAATGPDVEGISPGDVVAWAGVGGSYSELVALPADRVVTVPDGVDPETAAAVMLQGITAHYLATSTFPLGEGDRCLVHAAAGGVGNLLVQVAKRAGAEVFATVGSPDKEEVALAAGADHVILYRDVPFDEAIVTIAGERPLDVIYDGVGAATFDAGLGLLRPRGYMVTFGNASGPVAPVAPLTLSTNGSLFLTRPTMGDYIRDPYELQARTTDLFDWILRGDLVVHIGGRYPLDRAADAHRDLESRATTGKLLVIP